jgi:tetratricopeptide (TPR) repeat protein
VIALGFPLGSRTQADAVNASVVRGNVRRAFENMFQIDASLHGGNSGGPVIDARGRVIGIVSAVAVDFTQGMVPMVTPVWDIGLILPITEAVKLLLELKAGQAKWNGVVDFAEESALTAIRQTAAEGRWAAALAAAEAKLGKNPQPAMVTAAGMLHLCAADYPGARRRFVQALSMDAEDHQARLMLALIDRLSGEPRNQADYRDLGSADWRSPAEFQGYLLNLLEGRVTLEEGLKGGTSAGERDWLRTIGGILLMGRGRPAEAQSLLEPVVLAADTENWAFFLARAKLEEIRRQGRAAPVEPFERKLRESIEARRARQAQLSPLWARLAAGGLSLEERRGVLEQIAALDPENQALRGILAYLCAAAGDFPEAIEKLRAHQSAEGRLTAMRLSLGLLEAGLLRHQGAGEKSRERLEAFAERTRDPGYLAIADFLGGRSTEDALRRQIGDSPEYTLAAFAAAGFWAEGSQDRKNAMRFYREALGTFLDNWIEYDFVRERVKNLKRVPGG